MTSLSLAYSPARTSCGSTETVPCVKTGFPSAVVPAYIHVAPESVGAWFPTSVSGAPKDVRAIGRHAHHAHLVFNLLLRVLAPAVLSQLLGDLLIVVMQLPIVKIWDL